MLFRLSVRNMKKSFKDYAIYFLTLVLGVAIFYMFNSLDSQQAMLQVSQSQRSLIGLLISMLNWLSIFIAIVLGLLIVYANNFLVNRRKKEFGIYMTLGMGRRQISKIILFETILIGCISLIAGLVIGVFASQFMSILVAKLFEANMSRFEFVFSQDACIKTCIYFAVMYVAVMIFNTITISRYKLINLLTATKKNEKLKLKNPIICTLTFIAAVGLLGYAYWLVTGGLKVGELATADKLLIPIIMGIVGTVLVFWSLSGFILKVVQLKKSTYLKGTNMFVLRQLNNKINTTVISMSVICLMLFMTISVLSSSLSLRNSMQKELLEMTPVDINLYKTANLPESYKTKSGKVVTLPKESVEDSRKPISQTFKDNGFDMNHLKDVTEIEIYGTNKWRWKDSLSDYYEEAKRKYPRLMYETPETLIKVSDYNKVAKLYGTEQFELENDEYITLCDFDSIKELRNTGLKRNSIIKINGKEYHSKYEECKSGFIIMTTSHTNTGIILVPDSFELKEEWKQRYVLIANYNASTDEEKKEIEGMFSAENYGFTQNLYEKGIQIDGTTRTQIIEASTGTTTIIVFLAIYLGIIFLIASSAILALKQLTESTDNKQRYVILRKIGCDEKMIHKALFRQIGIFFMLPLILAIIHSIFGIQFLLFIFETFASGKELIPSIIATTIIIGGVYGMYFLATYYGSKNIIKEE